MKTVFRPNLHLARKAEDVCFSTFDTRKGRKGKATNRENNLAKKLPIILSPLAFSCLVRNFVLGIRHVEEKLLRLSRLKL